MYHDYTFFEIEDGVVEINGDVKQYFQDTEEAYEKALNEFKKEFNNRGDWFNLAQNTSSDLPSEIETDFIWSKVVETAYYILKYEFDTDQTKEEFYEEMDELVTLDFSVRTFHFYTEDSLAEGISFVDDSTIQVYDYFTVQLPITKYVLEEFEDAYFSLEITDEGELESEMHLVSIVDSHQFEDADLMEYLFKTTPTRKEKEAYTLYKEHIDAVRVAIGDKPVSFCSNVERLQNINSFPLDCIVWDVDKNQENTEHISEGDETNTDEEPANDEDTDEEDTESNPEHKNGFLYNTNLLSRDELIEQLKSAYSENAEKGGKQHQLGLVLGYPEWAVKSYSNLIQEDIPPYYNNLIKIYNKLLNDESISREKLDEANYTSYVTPLEKLDESAHIGQQTKQRLKEFVDEYNIPEDTEDLFEPDEFPTTEEISHTFEDFWICKEENRHAYEKL